jgi:hypothetical protein
VRKWAAASAAALVFALLPGEVRADYWYCQFTPFRNQKLAEFISDKYSETGNAGCAYFPDENGAQAELKRNEELLTNKTNNGKSIATGWRYTGPP